MILSAFGTKQTSLVAPHMSAFGGKADIGAKQQPSVYLFRFSKVLTANTIPKKMMPSSASVRMVLRAMPRPKCATTPNMVATMTADPSTKIGTTNRAIPQICDGLG